MLARAYAEHTGAGGHGRVVPETERPREPDWVARRSHQIGGAVRFPRQRSMFAPCPELELLRARRADRL